MTEESTHIHYEELDGEEFPIVIVRPQESFKINNPTQNMAVMPLWVFNKLSAMLVKAQGDEQKRKAITDLGGLDTNEISLEDWRKQDPDLPMVCSPCAEHLGLEISLGHLEPGTCHICDRDIEILGLCPVLGDPQVRAPLRGLLKLKSLDCDFVRLGPKKVCDDKDIDRGYCCNACWARRWATKVIEELIKKHTTKDGS